MEKPIYKIPTMKEINSLKWNGKNVVSTFSGGGGSCLGYRMAGYKVLYANEFVEEARKTYSANTPTTYVDGRDIRTVTPEEILEITKLKKGELDLFDGSPPCCAFSTAGAREKGWGKQRAYSTDKVQRADDLFLEYIRILNGLQPKVFIAENVSGLIKGTAKGYFNYFISEMRKCGYKVKASLIDASLLNVPQKRQRVIFCGVRNDIPFEPTFPKPLEYIRTLGEAFEGLQNDEEQAKELCEKIKNYKIYEIVTKLPKNPKKRFGADKIMNGTYFNLKRESMYEPCSTICQMNGQAGSAGNIHPLYDRKFTIPELKRITSIPDDFILTGTFEEQWERLGRMVPPLMMKAIAENIYNKILSQI